MAEPEVLDRLEHHRTDPLPAGWQRVPDTRRLDLHSHFAPDDAAAAAAITAAVEALHAENVRAAGQAVQWLTGRVAATGARSTPSALSRWAARSHPYSKRPCAPVARRR
ncbi:hypothetical protein ACFRQM_15660 [Streptomyces sp. NPDC056831]|uniref:hypothetical protein n=1 Tax=Streptomyces sp. NPDC056831 TaxID=3345954 RepID=UPI00368B31AC